jgi:outer membrane protein insertion porin family
MRGSTQRIITAALMFAAGAVGAPVLAQTLPPAVGMNPQLDAAEGRPIRRIVFVVVSAPRPEGAPVVPVPTLDAAVETLARNQLRLTEGMPFSAELASADISRLNRLGRFQQVESQVQNLGDGTIELRYLVRLQPLVSDVQVVGNTLLSDQELAREIDVLTGTPVDPQQVERAARRIEARYREKGYFNALVTIDQEEMDRDGIVLFKIREGERTRVKDIRFEGNASIKSSQLEGEVETREAWFLETGPVDLDLIAGDVGRVAQFYRDRGFLDVRVEYVLTPSPNGKEAIVTFVIDEGRPYTLGDVRVVITDEGDGGPVFSTAQIMGLMTVKPGATYGDAELRDSEKAIKDAYGVLGFVDARVTRRELRREDGPVVDLLLGISQGRQFKTGLVTIRGNDHTRDDVVRRLVTIQPDRPLDTTEIAETERRLRRANLFAPPSGDNPGPKVTIQPEDPANPGYRDVLVEVEETNTGSFNIGGGAGSDSGFFASISITQRNFDVTDTPDTFGELFTGDAFRGGAQTLTLQLIPGDRSQVYALSLSDRALGDTDISGSGTIEYRKRVYSAYDEQRIGARGSLGTTLGSRWTFDVPFGVQQISLSDIDDDAPAEFFDFEDDTLLYNVGVRLSRATIDDQAFPSRGSRTVIDVEQFTGDYTFSKIEASYSQYVRLAEDVLGRKTTLQLTTRAGLIPQDSEDVPFFERLYQGGQNFRGFDFRAVSPVGIDRNGNITDDPVGGTFSFFAGAEVRQPVFTELVSVVAFLDTGTVDTEIAFDKYRVSVGMGFRIFVEQLSPVPLAVDFGIPLMKEDTDEERLFSFSLDVPFR